MVAQFGMSEKLGLVSLEGQRTALFLPVPGFSQKEYSEETARCVDEEVRQTLAQAHETVTRILSSHREHLEEVTKLLLEKDVVARPERLKLLNSQHVNETTEQKGAAGNHAN